MKGLSQGIAQHTINAMPEVQTLSFQVLKTVQVREFELKFKKKLITIY